MARPLIYDEALQGIEDDARDLGERRGRKLKLPAMQVKTKPKPRLLNTGSSEAFKLQRGNKQLRSDDELMDEAMERLMSRDFSQMEDDMRTEREMDRSVSKILPGGSTERGMPNPTYTSAREYARAGRVGQPDVASVGDRDRVPMGGLVDPEPPPLDRPLQSAAEQLGIEPALLVAVAQDPSHPNHQIARQIVESTTDAHQHGYIWSGEGAKTVMDPNQPFTSSSPMLTGQERQDAIKRSQFAEVDREIALDDQLRRQKAQDLELAANDPDFLRKHLLGIEPIHDPNNPAVPVVAQIPSSPNAGNFNPAGFTGLEAMDSASSAMGRAAQESELPGGIYTGIPRKALASAALMGAGVGVAPALGAGGQLVLGGAEGAAQTFTGDQTPTVDEMALGAGLGLAGAGAGQVVAKGLGPVLRRGFQANDVAVERAAANMPTSVGKQFPGDLAWFGQNVNQPLASVPGRQPPGPPTLPEVQPFQLRDPGLAPESAVAARGQVGVQSPLRLDTQQAVPLAPTMVSPTQASPALPQLPPGPIGARPVPQTQSLPAAQLPRLEGTMEIRAPNPGALSAEARQAQQQMFGQRMGQERINNDAVRLIQEEFGDAPRDMATFRAYAERVKAAGWPPSLVDQLMPIR